VLQNTNDMKVYILGAGVNKAIKVKHDVKRISEANKNVNIVSPPLSTNFFGEAFSMRNRSLGEEAIFDPEYKLLWSYIDEYWKRNPTNLERNKFDLEEFLTFIELQLADANKKRDKRLKEQLANIRFLQIKFLYCVLHEFESDLNGFLDYPSDPKEILDLVDCFYFKKLGQLLWKEKPTIITFNYDTFIESAIERASGKGFSKNSTTNRFQSQVKENELDYSYWNWNRALAYGIKFDETMLYDKAIGNKRKFFEGNTFYENNNNNLYKWPILKLHGSINWFQFLRATPNTMINEKNEGLLRISLKLLQLSPSSMDVLCICMDMFPPLQTSQ
jgi:hypothetical protein